MSFNSKYRRSSRVAFNSSFRIVRVALFALVVVALGPTAHGAEKPSPLLNRETAVDWWFVFKFNTASFPGCKAGATRACIFDGDAPDYKGGFGQQYVYASSNEPSFEEGDGCAGDTLTDPIGATFDQVYEGNYHYIIWNDQFYNDPQIKGCGKSCSSPWGHSKGILVWDDAGDGFVMQVTTPNWPGAGSKRFPRKRNGNTLGCLTEDGEKPQNNVKVSQHFFALRLNKDDLLKVLMALKNASVVTNPNSSQIVKTGGPADVRAHVSELGQRSDSTVVVNETLSTGVQLISKPSKLNVPPWQMVSAILDRTPLRVATWWMRPEIPTTIATTSITCWDDDLVRPGRVEIATTGQWNGETFGLTGGGGPNFNHAKFGVSLSKESHLSIFGDLNQQGALRKPCPRSQNARGGLFFVLKDPDLFASLTKLIEGKTAPTRAPRK